MVARQLKLAGRFRFVARQLVMVGKLAGGGGEGGGGALLAVDGLGDAAVEQAAADEAGFVVDEAAEFVVGEVELGGRNGRFPHQISRQKLL